MKEMTIDGAETFILKNQILQYFVIVKTLIEKHQIRKFLVLWEWCIKVLCYSIVKFKNLQSSLLWEQ